MVYLVSNILVLSILGFLLFLLLIRRGKAEKAQYFVPPLMSMIVWGILHVLIQAYPVGTYAILTPAIAGQLIFVFGLGIAGGLVIFAYHFPRSLRYAHYVTYGLTGVFVLTAAPILFSSWVVDTRYGVYNWGHPIVATLILGLLVWAIGVFIYQLRQCDTETELRQTMFFLVGICIAIIWASITNLLIPVLAGSTQIAQYGPLGIIFIGVFGVYAIFQYRLFQIQVLTAELFLELIGVILLILTFTSSSVANFVINGVTLGIYGVVAYVLYGQLWQRVKQEETLAEKNAELRRILETKDDFLRMVSHQLRTPMTSLSGFLSMLVEKDNETYTFNREAYQTLIRIYVNTQRLSAVVNDILFTNALNAGKFGINVRETDMKEILEGVLDTKEEVMEFYNKELTYTVEGDSFTMRGDPVKLKEVCNSILDNAIYYGEKDIDVVLTEQAENIQVSVADDGIGITSEEESHVWEKFARSEEAKRRSPNSSGLALYVSCETIKRHDGTIWFESEGRGEGTTFYIQLPKSGPSEERTSEETAQV